MFIPRSPCSWTDWCLFPDLPAPGPIDVYSQIYLLLDQLMFIPRSPCSWTDWCLFPDLPAPGPIELLLVKTDSVSLRWGPPAGLTTPHKFRVTWRSEGDCGRSLIVTSGKVYILWTHFRGRNMTLLWPPSWTLAARVHVSLQLNAQVWSEQYGHNTGVMKHTWHDSIRFQIIHMNVEANTFRSLFYTAFTYHSPHEAECLCLTKGANNLYHLPASVGGTRLNVI